MNRAREALRVIEDHARFVLDDASASAALKQARHRLRDFAAAFDWHDLLDSRDIVSDVGRGAKTPSELARSTSTEVLRAAFARLTEAARTLGEYAKLDSCDAAELAEKLRYRAYELEQLVALRGGSRAAFRAVRLYVLITESLCRRDWLDVAEAALRGGAGCLQLREKHLPDAELLRRAQRLRDLTRAHDALLIVNDRPDLARLAEADGVHLGQDDLCVRDARRIGGARLLIGKSTHTREQFAAALVQEPDYLAVGPIFASDTKPQPQLAGPALLRELRAETALPLVAIGGISVENASEVWAAGADCLSVCAAVISAAGPEKACGMLLASRGAESASNRLE